MWAARYFNPRYWASRFWAKVGADAALDVCGDVVGRDQAYALAVGLVADHRSIGSTAAYMSATGGDEECSA